MDLMMPEMDGLELTKRIKAIVPQKPVIIVAVTACALVEDMKKCIEVGMNDFISKPVKMQQFRAVLWKWGKIIMKKKSADCVLVLPFQLPSDSDQAAH